MRSEWGENFFGDDNLLDVYIRYIKYKIKIDGSHTLIHTIRGAGFILQAQESIWKLIITLQTLNKLSHQTCYWILG